jgi:hypothetical protein
VPDHGELALNSPPFEPAANVGDAGERGGGESLKPPSAVMGGISPSG